MKKLIIIILLFSSFAVSAQMFYPAFNQLFLKDNEDESLFSPELHYFREGLKANSNMLFIGNLQASQSTDGSAAFYSFKMVPGIFESNFLNSGVFLKFAGNIPGKSPSFNVEFEEFTNRDDAGGSGRISIHNNGFSLLFDEKLVKVFDEVKKESDKNDKAEFLIERIEYKIDKTNLEIEFTGCFMSDIIVKRRAIKNSVITKLRVNANKKRFTISYVDPVKKKKKYLIRKRA